MAVLARFDPCMHPPRFAANKGPCSHSSGRVVVVLIRNLRRTGVQKRLITQQVPARLVASINPGIKTGLCTCKEDPETPISLNSGIYLKSN